MSKIKKVLAFLVIGVGVLVIYTQIIDLIWGVSLIFIGTYLLNKDTSLRN